MLYYFHICTSHRSRSYMASNQKLIFFFSPSHKHHLSGCSPPSNQLLIQQLHDCLSASLRQFSHLDNICSSLYPSPTAEIVHNSTACRHTWHVESKDTRCESQSVTNDLSSFYLFQIHTAITGHCGATTGPHDKCASLDVCEELLSDMN